MSTRAYKVVVPAELADDPAWNVSKQQEINDYLGIDDYEGEQTALVVDIQRMLKDPTIELEPEQRAQFERDIEGEPLDGAVYYQFV